MTQDLISLLDTTGRVRFIDYLQQRNKRYDTRNVQLFRALLKGKETEIQQEIGINAYNALKKRLTDCLLDFVAIRTLETEALDEIQAIQQVMVARKLIRFEHFKSGFRILKNAERAALRLDQYSILNEIYHTQIEFSDHPLAGDQSEILDKLEQNTEVFLTQERLNVVYALVKKAFKEARYGQRPVNLEEVLQENYRKFSISKQHGYSFKSLYQLANIADIVGTQRNDYHSIQLFFIDKIADLKGGVADNERSLIYHIDLLYSIANIYFRKKDFEKSRHFLEDMYAQMQRFDRKLYPLRYVKYITLEALNLNFLGQFKRAEVLLDDLFASEHAETDLLLNARLTRAMIHFQQGELKQSKKCLGSLRQSDARYLREVGIEWLMNFKYLEILLHLEMGDLDYADARITSLTRKFKRELQGEENQQILPFLRLVREFEQNPALVSSEAFAERVETAIHWRAWEEEDLLRMSFYAWLKAKMVRRDRYEVTLELVRGKA